MASGAGGVASDPFGYQQPPGYSYTNKTPIGSVNPGTGMMFDPNLGHDVLTGAQKGTNAGQALKALADASGMPLLGSMNGYGAGAGVGYGATVPYPDTTAANAATFARAKDQTGQNSRASLTALQNELGGAGMLGSGQEAGATRDIVANGAGALNEVGREQAISDVGQQAHRADAAYQGQITQRGQDINAAQQAAARQQQVMQGLLSVINSSGILY